ncbi:MADS-box transcription factor PHERES 2 [Dorcoceras hygrometricum]|uniref:MADS-box transcription factor PHERES 2 n=1 Tax=Dorcoceras hygrometricum TaxID=472368 RepID=A0A2Z7BMF6_9LAMI|nr:MADS-box transcription factor PHERES 2 [Dorcoceras hygrometricum]
MPKIHKKILDERQRNKVFKNRSEGLLKKLSELSILCGIDAAMVIHKRDEDNATLWPSPEMYRDRMQKFLNFSSIAREKKMVTHEKYLDQRVLDESSKISYGQLNLINVKSMKVLADYMVERVGKIISDYQLASEQEQPPPNPSSFEIPPPVPKLSSVEDLLSWSDTWFTSHPMESRQGDGGGIQGDD